MPLRGIENLFWAAGLCGHILLLVVLFGCRRAARFPLFTALICGNVLRTGILFAARQNGSDHAYYVAYVAALWVDVILQTLVVYEVASHVFRPLNRWTADTRFSLQVLMGISLAIALALTWLASPSRKIWQFAAPVKANFFSSVLMSELFLGLLFLSATVGLPWRTHVARIAHGLGTFSVLEVVIDAWQSLNSAAFNPRLSMALTSSRMTVYLLCLTYWIVTLWRDPPPQREMPLATRKELEELSRRVAYDVETLRHWRKQ